MATILMLTHRIPYPPDKGDKIRSWNLVTHLAARHRLYLGYFVDDPADHQHEAVLKSICASAHGVPIDPKRARILSASGFLDGAPLSVAYYRSVAMRRWVDGVLADARPDLLFGFCSGIGEYLFGPATEIPLVMDFCDVDSEKWLQYADESRFPMNHFYRREAKTLLSFERRLAARAAASLFVTADESDLFRRLAPEVADRVDTVSNGVDLAAFSPDRHWPEAIPAGGPAAVFTGAMDYRPNVDAVVWFAQEVWPRIRATVADARFFIVGAKPAPSVRALDGVEGITVTGRVPDVQHYIAQASCVVAPVRIARGVQNKVLEGMAMARPVVTTPQGFEGIAAVPDRDLLVREDAEGFAAAVAGILRHGDRAGLGSAARRLMVERYSWEATLAGLDAKLAEVRGEERHE